jgi:hypothetical protein
MPQVLPGKGVGITVCSYAHNIGQTGAGCSASGALVVFSVLVFEKELYLH